MVEVLRATSSADFLAMVPALAGFRPRNSVVFVMFAGKRSAGAPRLDLPTRRRAADYRAIASAAIGMASRAQGVDRLVPVVYTDSTFEGEHGIPWLDFMRHVRKQLRDAGFSVGETFCVAADGWGSYVDRDSPASGWSLSEIEQSPLRGDAEWITGPLPDLDALSQLAIPSADELDAMRDWLAQRTGADDGDRIDAALDDRDDPSSRIEAILGEGDSAGTPPVDDLGWLLLHVQAPSNRDAAMLQIAFGAEFAGYVRRDNARFADLQAMTGLSMDDVVQQEVDAGRASFADAGSNGIMGIGPGRPDVGRLRRGIAVMMVAVACSPTEYRLAPLCILAWMWWALGLGSVASRFVELAIGLDSKYRMANLLYALFSGGRVPDWAFGGGGPDEVQFSLEDEP
jgi:hypothetical protein